MSRIYEKELIEINKDMGGETRRNYIQMQEKIKRYFTDIANTREFSGVIQNVYSRADHEPIEPLKSDKKIALKLHKWRKTNPSARMSDIHDIIGVTIVCNYPSEIHSLVKFIEKDLKKTKKSRDFYVSKSEYKFPEDNSGYNAHHLHLSGKGTFFGITGEVQIKTFLTLAWGYKTHDLTYKPTGEIDKKLTDYMEKLTRTVQLLDEQSEILKGLISESWDLDTERRDVARKRLMHMFSPNTLDDDIKLILNNLTKHENKLAISPLNDNINENLRNRFNKYIDKHGYNKHLCRCACIYAITRTHSDLNDWALKIVSDWVESLENSEPRHRAAAIILFSLCCMSLGEYYESVHWARKAVEVATEYNDTENLQIAKSNLSYLIAEAYFHGVYDEATGGGKLDRSGSEKHRKEAIKIARELQKPEDGSLSSDKLDTIGSVLICCGITEEEIREGLQLCIQAYEASDTSKYEDIHGLFFALHEKRAFRKLSQF